jgi:DNA-binding CsgD family transcriptional regulator
MLSLTTSEQTKIANVSRLLVSPLDMPNVGEWYSAVSRDMKSLLHAERSILSFPSRQELRYFATGVDVRDVAGYPDRVEALASKVAVWKRVVRLGSYGRTDLWHPILDDYFKSEYYNDFIVPLRLFDPIGIGIALSGPPSASTVSQFQFYAAREGITGFAQRGASLLRLLLPACEAGLRICHRLAADRSTLGAALDAIRDGVLLCDNKGAVLHQNTALLVALRRDPERVRLVEAVHVVARRVAGFVTRPGVSRDAPTTPLVREVRTSHAAYRVCGTAVGDWFNGGTSVMVCVERLTPEPMSPETLVSRFSLTKRGAEVTLLVADGSTNEEIAQRLGISAHTVRHHLEIVMARLGVKSRASVARKVLT